jgi:hypothetical protein
MLENNEIYKMLLDEQRTLKKNLSGVRGRASRTGKITTLRTPISLLTGKARIEYQNNSKVDEYNMYTEIMSYEEFIKLPLETQKNVLQQWRDTYGTQAIKRKWDTGEKRNGWRAYDFVKRWNLPIMTNRGPKGPNKLKNTNETKPIPSCPTGSIINYVKTVNGENLSNQLLKIADYVDKEVMYGVQIVIIEKE